MAAASLTFATPWGALVALVVVVPLAALTVAWRRAQHAARIVGLTPAPRRTLVGALATLALAAVASWMRRTTLRAAARRVGAPAVRDPRIERDTSTT